LEISIDRDLVKQLRIDDGARDAHAGGRPGWLMPLIATLVVLAAAGGAGAWWWTTQRAPVVQTATAVAAGAGGGAAAVLQATGYLTARRSATVSAQITGTLTQVLIEEGDRVQKGQVLARLDDSALKASLNVAQAQVAAMQAQVAQAQAQLRQAEADSRRQDELAASGMMSRQAAEQARTAVQTVGATLEARRREGDAARAQLAAAQVQYDYTVVRAPFAGVVTVKAAQVGEIISPLSAGGGFTRTGVGTIVDMDSLEVVVDVNEAFIGQVRPEMACEAVPDAYPDWKIPARVLAIIPAADRGKATVKVRIALDQKDARLVPDMGVRVAFLGQKPAAGAPPPKGVLVPPLALVQRDSAVVVFVVGAGDRVERRAVKAAPQEIGSLKLVTDGLAAGETVVLSPPAALADGDRITIEKR
jgi:RND family efflux transporter MFP subunit